MAILQAFNAAGAGFNMSATDSNGWAFLTADPSVTTYLAETVSYGDGVEISTYDVYGSSQVDEFQAKYWTDGYTAVIHDVIYKDAGYNILSITDLNLYTTVDDLDANDWYVSLNGGSDAFYGNDFADIIRAGQGNDIVYSYGGRHRLWRCRKR